VPSRVLVNVLLRSGDAAVTSHRLRNFDLPPSDGMQPPLLHAGRRWVFSCTRFERDETGSEVRWLLFLDDGPEQESPLGQITTLR
jgi:hypothetical protein